MQTDIQVGDVIQTIYTPSLFSTNDGTYVGGDPEDLTYTRVDFDNIERIVVIGSQQSDRLEGTEDSYRFLGFNLPGLTHEEANALFAANTRGDDFLSGGAGDDVLIGKSGSDDSAGRRRQRYPLSGPPIMTRMRSRLTTTSSRRATMPERSIPSPAARAPTRLCSG